MLLPDILGLGCNGIQHTTLAGTSHPYVYQLSSSTQLYYDIIRFPQSSSSMQHTTVALAGTSTVSNAHQYTRYGTGLRACYASAVPDSLP